MTVYAVFADMEDDVPCAYCATEEDARALLEGNDIGDFIPCYVSERAWMGLLIAQKGEEG